MEKYIKTDTGQPSLFEIIDSSPILKLSEKAVLKQIIKMSRYGEDEFFTGSNQTLADKTGLGLATVKRCISNLRTKPSLLWISTNMVRHNYKIRKVRVKYNNINKLAGVEAQTPVTKKYDLTPSIPTTKHGSRLKMSHNPPTGVEGGSVEPPAPSKTEKEASEAERKSNMKTSVEMYIRWYQDEASEKPADRQIAFKRLKDRLNALPMGEALKQQAMEMAQEARQSLKSMVCSA